MLGMGHNGCSTAAVSPWVKNSQLLAVLWPGTCEPNVVCARDNERG